MTTRVTVRTSGPQNQSKHRDSKDASIVDQVPVSPTILGWTYLGGPNVGVSAAHDADVPAFDSVLSASAALQGAHEDMLRVPVWPISS